MAFLLAPFRDLLADHPAFCAACALGVLGSFGLVAWIAAVERREHRR